MKIVVTFVLVFLVAAVASSVFFRRVPDDPAIWHVDPLAAVKPDKPNAALIRPEGGDAAAPVFDVAPEALAEEIDAVALSEPRTKRIAGAPADLWMTYVQRSALWGFPDYVSVKVMPAGEGATYAAFSRARFGYSDMGVNAGRMARWQTALEARLAP